MDEMVLQFQFYKGKRSGNRQKLSNKARVLQDGEGNMRCVQTFHWCWIGDLLTSTLWMLRKTKMSPDSARKRKMGAYLDGFRHMVISFCLP